MGKKIKTWSVSDLVVMTLRACEGKKKKLAATYPNRTFSIYPKPNTAKATVAFVIVTSRATPRKLRRSDGGTFP